MLWTLGTQFLDEGSWLSAPEGLGVPIDGASLGGGVIGDRSGGLAWHPSHLPLVTVPHTPQVASALGAGALLAAGPVACLQVTFHSDLSFEERF